MLQIFIEITSSGIILSAHICIFEDVWLQIKGNINLHVNSTQCPFLQCHMLYNNYIHPNIPMGNLYRTTVQRETVHLTRTLCKQTCKVIKNNVCTNFSSPHALHLAFGKKHLAQQLIWSLLGVWLHTTFVDCEGLN